MEHNRNDSIALVAGYTGKMKTFSSLNPGLRSRFNLYFDFADYEMGQGVEIFELFCAKAKFRLTSSARDKVFSSRSSNRFVASMARVGVRFAIICAIPILAI